LRLGDQGNKRGVDALEAHIVALEGPTKIIEISFDCRPAFLDEFITEAIRSKRLVIWELFDHIINFISSEGVFKGLQPLMGLNKRG
jgi:hypothetical protein